MCRSSGFLYGRGGSDGGGGTGADDEAASSVSTGASPLARWGDDGGGGTNELGPANPTDSGGAGRLAEAGEVTGAVGGWVDGCLYVRVAVSANTSSRTRVAEEGELGHRFGFPAIPHLASFLG